MMSNYFLIFNSEKIEIDFEIYNRLPDEIKKQIFEKREYLIQAKVSKSIFDSFLEYIRDKNKAPSINLSNIEDFILLNNEFNVMSDYLNKNEHYDISLISIMCRENTDTSTTEKEIAQKLDYYLDRYSDEMYKIPIQKLSNILRHKERVLKNSNKVYEFITKGLAKNINFGIFFDSLDYTDLSYEYIKDFLSKYKNLGFAPKLDISFIEGIYKQLEEVKFQQQQTLSKMMQSQHDQYEKIKMVYDIKINSSDIVTFNLPLFTNVIHDDLFMCNQNLVSVQLPQFVISIDKKAFYRLRSLKHIRLSYNLHYIGENAFNECESLELIEFSPFLIKIDHHAFSNCRSLKKLHLPSSLTELGYSTFSACKGLEYIELSNSITTIESCLFDGCSSLKHIEIPPSVTEIKSSAFMSCKSLEKISIPNSVSSLGSGAFDGCESLNEINIPDSITIICSGTFSKCIALKEVNVPQVTQIQNSAFEKCTVIKQIQTIDH